VLPPALIRSDSAGILISDLRSIEPGARLYIHVPTQGEFLHQSNRAWTPADGIYEIDLQEPLSGRVGLRLAGPLPAPGKKWEKAPRLLHIHLEEQRDGGQKASYRLSLSESQLADGWIGEQIVPGRYRCTLQWGEHQRSKDVAVQREQVCWVDVRMD
jgi:hypothetical protein